MGKYLCVCQNFSARGPPGGAGPPNVNLGPHNISESTRARKLKLKTPLDRAYSKILGFSTHFFPLGGVNLGPLIFRKVS